MDQDMLDEDALWSIVQRRKRKKPLFDPGEKVRDTAYELAGWNIDKQKHALAHCVRLNGAKACETRDYSGRRTIKVAYCKDDEGSPSYCRAVSHISFFRSPDGDPQAYIEWFGAEPHRKGWGKKVYGEVEEYLRKKKCVKRIALHSVGDARGFWESRGYKVMTRPLKSDGEWWENYSSLARYHKRLDVPKSCEKRRPS